MSPLSQRPKETSMMVQYRTGSLENSGSGRGHESCDRCPPGCRRSHWPHYMCVSLLMLETPILLNSSEIDPLWVLLSPRGFNTGHQKIQDSTVSPTLKRERKKQFSAALPPLPHPSLPGASLRFFCFGINSSLIELEI